MDKLHKLEIRLGELWAELHRLQTEGVEEIRVKRELADMGDDYRENEGAKLVMEQESLLHQRMGRLRWEIGEVKREIIRLKNVREM